MTEEALDAVVRALKMFPWHAVRFPSRLFTTATGPIGRLARASFLGAVPPSILPAEEVACSVVVAMTSERFHFLMAKKTPENLAAPFHTSTLNGMFSAVSTPMFTNQYSLERA